MKNRDRFVTRSEGQQSIGQLEVQKEGPRKIVSTCCGAGIEDKTYYYNIIDYDGDMSDFVNLTRHKTLTGAIKEAKRFALDRKWAGPGVSTVYAGMPPRIVRTVKLIEMHRVVVNGPMPKTPTVPEPELIIEPGKDLSLEKLMRPGKKIFKDFWDQYEIGEDKNVGKPHPALK